MSTTDGSITCEFEDAKSKMNLDFLISPDDASWVDSCLTFDTEINMDSLKEALLKFVSYPSEPLETSNEKRREYNVEISPLTEEMDIPMNFEIDFEADPFNETSENMDEDDPLEEKTDSPTSAAYLAKAFLPTFKDEMIDFQFSSDFDFDFDFLDFSEFAIESSSEDIFKVWDLCLPGEDNSQMKWFSKAVGDKSFDGSEIGEGGIDDLVAGIADMSLQRRFGRKYLIRK